VLFGLSYGHGIVRDLIVLSKLLQCISYVLATIFHNLTQNFSKRVELSIIFIVHPALDMDSVGFLPAKVLFQVVYNYDFREISADAG
jgi:hypothetical protein